KNDLDEMHQTVPRAGGTAGAAIDDEQQIIAGPGADRRGQFTRPQLGYHFAELGAQLLGAHPTDISPDGSRCRLRELLGDGGKTRALAHLLGEPFGEPPRVIVLLWIIDGEKNLGDAALRLIGGFLGA